MYEKQYNGYPVLPSLFPHLRSHRLPEGVVDGALKEVDIPVVGDLHAGVAQEVRDDLHLDTPGLQVAGEGIPEGLQPPMLHACRFAGLLHRRQQISAA